MSFSFLEGVDFCCGLVLAKGNGLRHGGCQLGSWSCTPSPGARPASTFFSLCQQTESLRFARESSAETGALGQETGTELRRRSHGSGGSTGASSPKGEGRPELWFLSLLKGILLLLLLLLPLLLPCGKPCTLTRKKEDPKDRVASRRVSMSQAGGAGGVSSALSRFPYGPRWSRCGGERGPACPWPPGPDPCPRCAAAAACVTAPGK